MAMSNFPKSAAAFPSSVSKDSPPPFLLLKSEFLMDPDNPVSGSKYSRQFAIFKVGYRVPEDWIKWVMAFREIENLMPMNDVSDFVDGSSYHEEVGGRRLRCPGK
jgi:hypothetical protein